MVLSPLWLHTSIIHGLVITRLRAHFTSNFHPFHRSYIPGLCTVPSRGSSVFHILRRVVYWKVVCASVLSSLLVWQSLGRLARREALTFHYEKFIEN